MVVTVGVLDVIRDAIRNHKQLTFVVEGYHRECCPHALGEKGDEWHVLCWQFGGESSSGFRSDRDRWRCFDVDDMENVRSRDGEWHRGVMTGRGAHPGSCIDEIDTLIDAAHAAEVRNT